MSGDKVTVSNFKFSPMHFTNRGSATHTLTAAGGQSNVGNIAQKQTKTFSAPIKPGTYNYICNIHQYMMGTLSVR